MRQDEAVPHLHIAQEPAADKVLSEDPFALLTGMLLDQQFPMERAFAGPAKILDRFGTLDASRIWTEAKSGADLMARLQALPGFGKQKSQIFTALVAKQLDVRPDGWERVAGDYSLEGYRSVADVVDAESLQ